MPYLLLHRNFEIKEALTNCINPLSLNAPNTHLRNKKYGANESGYQYCHNKSPPTIIKLNGKRKNQLTSEIYKKELIL